MHHLPGAVWLDGGCGRQGFSFLAWSPTATTTAADWVEQGRELGASAPSPADPGHPLPSGVIGYLGYGAGASVGPYPTEAPSWEPTLWLGRYTCVLAYRHATATWLLSGSPAERACALDLLRRAQRLPPPPPAPRRQPRSVNRATWEASVRRTLEWIAEGDCYQLNLTRPVWLDDPGCPWQAWRRLRATTPPAWGAFLRVDPNLTILSNSPEQFLTLDGRELCTEPIKGTRPRHPDPTLDAAEAQALRDSDKERAELTMIVDLCRNDLGKVAVPGSVRALPRYITAHTNVHHASQQVRATLLPGKDAWHALAAAFPPGSVTGAPKLRATQRIAALEPHPRGVYCGAIGFVSDTGTAAWSVAIRTAVIHRNQARWHVGSGIVADSDPAAEWEETVAKGTVLAGALGGAA